MLSGIPLHRERWSARNSHWHYRTRFTPISAVSVQFYGMLAEVTERRSLCWCSWELYRNHQSVVSSTTWTVCVRLTYVSGFTAQQKHLPMWSWGDKLWHPSIMLLALVIFVGVSVSIIDQVLRHSRCTLKSMKHKTVHHSAFYFNNHR